MMPKYFDIHSHLNFPDYKKDWDEVIGRLRETETYTITIGVDLKSSQEAIQIAEKYDGIYACIGVHPVDDPNQGFEKEEFEKLVKHPKVVAIGECGLDFYHAKKAEDYERQKKLFLDQVEFAMAHDKLLMIHARNAYEELLEIIKPLKKVHGDKLHGNIHFFAGSWEIAQRFFNIGFTLSFTGVITITSDYDEVVRKAPLEMILSETDAPFVTPASKRGQRNEPSFVSEVVKRIAEIRVEDLEVVRKALVANALRMVG